MNTKIYNVTEQNNEPVSVSGMVFKHSAGVGLAA